VRKPHVRPGGWAFQYANAYYPDVDDTAVVAMAMDRAVGQGPDDRGSEYKTAIARAREWIEGLQSANGGWGAFDSDNDYDYLNYIPFADHGALLDPPTADVTARCLSMLGQLGEVPSGNPVVARGVDYLLRTQEKDGSWFGRWGMNYIYGTWSVLCALNAVQRDPRSADVQQAVAWLKTIQKEMAGVKGGELRVGLCRLLSGTEHAVANAMGFAWVDGRRCRRRQCGHTLGVCYLARTQAEDGFWKEERFTATGFPRVFFLRYHGYAKYFPLWAMARYRNLKSGNRHPVLVGM
jgi:squalene-hopene/tetraprenyl-beta-curcumene cyclase